MCPGKQAYNLALVGAGRQGMAILEALVPLQRDDQFLRVVGVADLNPEAPGILYAYRHNLLVTVDFTDLFQIPELDIIVNATGRPEVSLQLDSQRPGRLIVLNVDRPLSWEGFWDLISMDLSSVQAATPLKIVIVGGGKAGHEVLQLIARDQHYQRRIDILGVVDLNSQAQGIILARNMGIPTFTDCAALLGSNPDLILELTGDPKVRDKIIQQKGPGTQIIDHSKARLFWDILYREEDRLRSKVENEIRLAGQRTRFQRIFNHLPDPVLVLSPDYLVEEANLPFLNRFHKTVPEVIGKPCYEVFHQFDEPCDRRGMACPLPRVLQSGQTVQISQRSANRGTIRYDEITMSPLCPPEGTQKRLIEVIKDITARKELEEALQSSEERTRKDKDFLETIVNGIVDHMMVIDLNYRIIEVNRTLLEMVGLKREEVVGRHCYEVSHHLKVPCTTPDHPCPLKEVVATGKAASATHVHFDKHRREHYYHVVCHPLFDEAGRIHRVVDLSRDITQEIMARMHILHDDKMSSLGKLSASVVHEINNPLTGILNFVSLMESMLAQGALSPEELGDFRRYLAMVHTETARISRTIANLLAFARKTKPEFKPLDLNAIAAETLSLTGYQMRLQGITVERQLAKDLLPVLADKGQMKQTFLNLFLNAQDAMPEGGVLTLETKNSRRHMVVVKVSDTGRGIPKESFSQIFEPFFTTKKTSSGAGLGLSVVYGIIRDHKGTIKVDSVLGQGTSFTIRLPAFKPGEKDAAT
ncbi:MAG: PAS domain-containing protein [Syntrophobacterales bacterium]|nr:PAS domain-containing protein [Syntrophobacterales bacterium]